MTPRCLAWIAEVTGGRLVGGDRVVDAIATDTRTLPPLSSLPPQAGEGARRADGGTLFVALKGGNFDGHEHVATAVAGGCVAALVAREVEAGVPQVVVADTQRALADMATAAMRARRHGKVVAITGSNGKTSVKT
ncbi:MAG: hypothetical protein J0L59_10445, partial [Xanthomonadales bacterium]|nr:hypothetical protein [Xanthomonadales bacterium]